MQDAFILGGVRTPVGKYGGALSHIRIDDLLGMTMVAACEKVGVPLEVLRQLIVSPETAAHRTAVAPGP